MKNNKTIIILMPVLIAIFLASGIYLGREMAYSNQPKRAIFSNHPFNENDKLNQVISYIKSDYVDTIKEKMIVEETINEILQNLDPHSYYIPKSKFKAVNDPLEGNFEGIGIEFRIKEDTVVVVRALAGGPSEKLGIMAGDRIVEVEEEGITGSKINNQKVVKLLKGPKGSTVNVKIHREGSTKLLDFAIQRDEIPLYSIDAVYMLNAKIGYLKVLRFAKSTYEEFQTAVSELKEQGMEKLVIDLRNNGGGYLQSATKIADEFLPEGKVIVYTEGKSRKRKNFYATNEGELESTEVAVLINENSASASEILAGALQDNDMGYIVGRRSFGKGLVQEGVQWPDGSAMRLTVARYYTPTGRSIQKPYDEGLDAYNNESYERFSNGELLSLDSIDFPDSLKYYTEKGKLVYGGGGIMPDYFVPLDTSNTSIYFGKLNYQGTFYQFGFSYVDKNREALSQEYNESNFLEEFQLDEKLMKRFYNFAEEKGIDYDEEGAEVASSIIKNRLKATIGRNLFGSDVFYQIVNQEDKVVDKAIDILSTKKSSS
ncbi:MAG: S41 family peptidase [Vicingaceae bacterium]